MGFSMFQSEGEDLVVARCKPLPVAVCKTMQTNEWFLVYELLYIIKNYYEPL